MLQFKSEFGERIDILNDEIEKAWQEMEKGQDRPYKDVFSDLRKRYV